MGSTEYFTRNPTWRQQMATRQQNITEKALLVEDITMAQVSQPPRSVLDNIITRMSVRFGLIPGDEPPKLDPAAVAWSEGPVKKDWKEGDIV
jgi:hypothetical protein